MRKAIFAVIAAIVLSLSVSATYTYKDPTSGVTFTVPSGFTEKALHEERQTISVKFVNYDDGVSCIMFGAIDMWELMDEEDLIGYSREETNMSIPDAEAIAEAICEGYGNLKTITINGVEYYQYSIDEPMTVLGKTYDVDCTFFITIDYGYIYIYQVHSISNQIPISVMTDMLKTAKYVDYGTKNKVTASANPTSAPKKTTSNSRTSISKTDSITTPETENGSLMAAGLLVIAVLITAAAYAAFPLLFAKFRLRSIKKSSYSWMCFGVNFVLALIYFAIVDPSGKYGAWASLSPWVFWTTIFNAIGRKVLSKRGMLEELKPGVAPTDSEISADIQEVSTLDADCDQEPIDEASAKPSINTLPSNPEPVAEKPDEPIDVPPQEQDEPIDAPPQEQHEPIDAPPQEQHEPIDAPPQEQDEQYQSVNYCRFCGKKIEKLGNFCPYCGKRL